MNTQRAMASWQRSRIFGLARELGMSTRSRGKDDDLHQLIHSRTGKESLTALTFDEAGSIIGELSHRQRFGTAPSPPRTKFAFVETPGGISEGQYKKIIALMCELRKLDETPVHASIEKRVAGIIREKLHISASAENPYRWLKYYHGVTLIEVIKGMLDTSRRKARAGRDTG